MTESTKESIIGMDAIFDNVIYRVTDLDEDGKHYILVTQSEELSDDRSEIVTALRSEFILIPKHEHGVGVQSEPVYTYEEGSAVCHETSAFSVMYIVDHAGVDDDGIPMYELDDGQFYREDSLVSALPRLSESQVHLVIEQYFARVIAELNTCDHVTNASLDISVNGLVTSPNLQIKYTCSINYRNKVETGNLFDSARIAVNRLIEDKSIHIKRLPKP